MAAPSFAGSVGSQSFSVDLTKFAEKTKLKFDVVLRKTLFSLTKSVIDRTPRDTGRLVGNWQFGTDQIPSGEVGSAASFKDSDGNAVASEMLSLYRVAIDQVKVGHVHYVINNLPYAPVVEYGLYPNPTLYGSKKRGEDEARIHTINGYSEQAPQGMVRVTVASYRQYLQEVLANL